MICKLSYVAWIRSIHCNLYEPSTCFCYINGFQIRILFLVEDKILNVPFIVGREIISRKFHMLVTKKYCILTSADSLLQSVTQESATDQSHVLCPNVQHVSPSSIVALQSCSILTMSLVFRRCR